METDSKEISLFDNSNGCKHSTLITTDDLKKSFETNLDKIIELCKKNAKIIQKIEKKE